MGMLISTRCVHGFMSNLIKKSWTDSNLSPATRVTCKEWPHEGKCAKSAVESACKVINHNEVGHLKTYSQLLSYLCCEKNAPLLRCFRHATVFFLSHCTGKKLKGWYICRLHRYTRIGLNWRTVQSLLWWKSEKKEDRLENWNSTYEQLVPGTCNINFHLTLFSELDNVFGFLSNFF